MEDQNINEADRWQSPASRVMNKSEMESDGKYFTSLALLAGRKINFDIMVKLFDRSLAFCIVTS